MAPTASFDVLVCTYCHAEMHAAPGAQYRIPPKIDDPPYEPTLPRVSIIGTRYVLLGKLAERATTDVFLARRDTPLTETVVLKIARGIPGGERLAREWKVLGELEDPAREGSAHFARVLPLRVLHGKVHGRDVLASAFRFRAGFQFTLEDVKREYPAGADARAIVWMWKRMLDVLGWLHDDGWCHGAIEPAHVIIHPRAHGVILGGWSEASRRAGDDVAASARAMATILAADAPAPIATLIARAADTNPGAWALRDELDRAAHEAFGPPRYHPFTLSGWG